MRLQPLRDDVPKYVRISGDVRIIMRDNPTLGIPRRSPHARIGRAQGVEVEAAEVCPAMARSGSWREAKSALTGQEASMPLSSFS